MQTPVKAQLHPSVKNSLLLHKAIAADAPPTGVLDMLDDAVALDGPGRLMSCPVISTSSTSW